MFVIPKTVTSSSVKLFSSYLKGKQTGETAALNLKLIKITI